MAELGDAISQLSNKQYDQFKSSISDILMDRLRGRIDNEKYGVGQSIFADSDEDMDEQSELELAQDEQPEVEEPEQAEETSDEEV